MSNQQLVSIFIYVLLTLNVIVCLLLIFLVLMQRPKNEGLGAAFGGGMTENLFGADTTNVLAKATRVLGGAFMLITLAIAALYSIQARSPSSVQAKLGIMPGATPAAAVSPAASPAAAAAATPAPASTPEATPAATATPKATTPAPAEQTP